MAGVVRRKLMHRVWLPNDHRILPAEVQHQRTPACNDASQTADTLYLAELAKHFTRSRRNLYRR